MKELKRGEKMKGKEKRRDDDRKREDKRRGTELVLFHHDPTRNTITT